MTRLLAKAHEIRAMLDGDEFVIVRPLKPQPSSVDESGRWYRMPSGGESLNCYDIPYAIGDSVVVKEAHATDGIRVLYAATDDINELRRVRSSAVMPRWASRLTLSVTEVGVKRLQDVTEEEARLAGDDMYYAPDFSPALHYWDKHHPKTPWDSNPWIVAARCLVHRCNISEMKEDAA